MDCDRYSAPALLIFLLYVLCLHPQCTNSAGNKTTDFQLNPVLHVPYHFVMNTSSNIAGRNAATAFLLVFSKHQDSILYFTLQFDALDSSFLAIFDRMHEKRNHPGDMKSRFNLSLAFLEATRDTFHGLVGSNGEVIRVTGYEAMINRISNKLNMDRRDVSSFLKDQVSNEHIKDIMNQLFLCVPRRVAKEGDTWISNIIFTIVAPVKHSHLVSLKSIRSDTVLLDVQTAITAKTSEQGSIYEEGKGSGEWRVSLATGVPFSWMTEQRTIYKTNYDTILKQVKVEGHRVTNF